MLREQQETVQQGRFRVSFAFADVPPEGLRAGQSFEISVQLGTPVQALWLPTGAYLDEGGGSVYVREPDEPLARRRAVQLGRRTGAQVEVLAGLRAGERVLVSASARHAGQPVLRLVGEGADESAPSGAPPR